MKITISQENSSPMSILIDDDKVIQTPGAMLKKHGSIFEIAEINDAWVSADYHFGKWMRKEGNELTSCKEDEERLIELHNSRVSKDDLFLFLGDIQESEFGDERKADSLEYVKQQVQRLNGKKIMVVGNNDTCDNVFYKECGFEEIFRRDRIITDKHVFSHFPVNMMGNSRINIHGHIHGTGNYFECNPENHIDCYWKLWNGPLHISELDQLLYDGKYSGHLEISTKPEGNDITL